MYHNTAAFLKRTAGGPKAFMGKVIAITNQKGGVGKTTTAVNLSAWLAELGKKTLMVDLDPQGNTTSGLGCRVKDNNSVYDAMMGRARLEDCIQKTAVKKLRLVGSDIRLAGAEVELVGEEKRDFYLKTLLGPVREDYDFILIDCPPSLSLLTLNALAAADSVLIPIQCEYYALEGVSKLLDSMKLVKNHLNPNLEIFGVLMTMYNSRTNLSRQVVEEVRSFFGDKVFEVMIPRTVKLSEAPSYGMPITKYEPSGKGAQAYRDLAKEVISRA